MTRQTLILAGLLVGAGAATFAACSSTPAAPNVCGATFGCPVGCNPTPAASGSGPCTCVPSSADVSFNDVVSCATNADCCTGTCDMSQGGDSGMGLCSSVASTATTGTTGSTTGKATGSTTGSASGGTGGTCSEPAPYGNMCLTDAQCGNSEFYCAGHRDGGYCKEKCTSLPCTCYGGYVCDTGTGICYNPTSTTSSTGGTAATGGSTGGRTSSTGAVTSASTSATGTAGTTTSRLTTSSAGTSASSTGRATTGGTTGSSTGASTGNSSTSSTSGGASTGGTTGGVIAVGDTCASCTTDATCAGSSDFCVADGVNANNYCAPDCSGGGACATGYSCQTLTDADFTNTPMVCYPTSMTCGATSGTTGGSTTGGTTSGGTTGGSTGSNVGAACTTATETTDCTSQYCKASICVCNCGRGRYPCVADADCCGTSSTCTTASTGCLNGVCQ